MVLTPFERKTLLRLNLDQEIVLLQMRRIAIESLSVEGEGNAVQPRPSEWDLLKQRAAALEREELSILNVVLARQN